MIRIAFTGGGTGGHIYPNLAVIEDLQDSDYPCELFYFGHPEKLEAKLLQSEELSDFKDNLYRDYVEFVGVESEPLIKTINPFKLFAWLQRFQAYTRQAKKALKEKNIDLVFGTGGYAAGPVFAACKELKIPYIIHNLDAHMGLANRAFVNDAAALCLGVCDLKIKPKNKKVFLTGNPISRQFLNELDKPKIDDGKLHLLITGGSQGAQSINTAIGELLPEFAKLNLDIVHVTGAKNYHDHKKAFLSNKEYDFYDVKDYSHEMPKLCAWSDIAICRSGAMTVAEMLASQVLCIFIPLPWAAHDHQSKNALAISELNAAITLDQDQDDLKETILDIVKKACDDKTYLVKYKENISKLDATKSNKEIIKVIMDTVNHEALKC